MTSTLHKLLPDEELQELIAKVPSGHTPLWEYWSEFVENFLDEGGSKDTISGVRTFLRFILRNTEIISIEDCNRPALLTKTLKKIKIDRNLKGSTFNKYKGCLNTYFRWLEDMEYIEENKVKKVRRHKELSTEVYALTEEQVEKVFLYLYQNDKMSTFTRRRNILFIDLLRIIGARRCELTDLKMGDIYFDNKKKAYFIKIHGAKQKGDIRHYKLPKWVADSYHSYLEIRNKTRSDEEFIFVSQSKRTGWTKKGATALCKLLTKELGFKVTTKSFRTHVATRLIREGRSLQEIAFYLGHRRTSTTLRYIKRSGILTENCGNVMANQINFLRN